MTRSPPRFVPGEPLPPYSYLPGRYPHPTRDPGGHARGRPHAAPAAVDPARWRSCRPYLHGIDLFNRGYYWEAHEAWEAGWHGCGRRGLAADFFKALIRLAGAGFKLRQGHPSAAARHATVAAALFGELVRRRGPHAGRFMGLDLDDLRRFATAIVRADGVLPDRPGAVAVVFDRALLPE